MQHSACEQGNKQCLWTAEGRLVCSPSITELINKPIWKPQPGVSIHDVREAHDIFEGFSDLGNKMNSENNAYMLPGDTMTSPNKEYIMTYRPDGNLILSKKVWEANVSEKKPSKAVVQSDGNFVMYNAQGKAYWSSKSSTTQKVFPHVLTLADNGVLELQNKNGIQTWKST
jgi:hypothetical protein